MVEYSRYQYSRNKLEVKTEIEKYFLENTITTQQGEQVKAKISKKRKRYRKNKVIV